VQLTRVVLDVAGRSIDARPAHVSNTEAQDCEVTVIPGLELLEEVFRYGDEVLNFLEVIFKDPCKISLSLLVVAVVAVVFVFRVLNKSKYISYKLII